jgi:predicted 2-oxoglutarate/Fe(II)-dependent dioxygenase YbiX
MDILTNIGYIKILESCLDQITLNELTELTTGEFWHRNLVDFDGKQIQEDERRKYSRILNLNKKLTDKIYDSIVDHIKDYSRLKYYLNGINPLLRFFKYNEGDYFKPHVDGLYKDVNGNISLLTIHIYLNDNFEGGTTSFYRYDEHEAIYSYRPKRGDIIIFDRELFLHSCDFLKSGTKYFAKTELMYNYN